MKGAICYYSGHGNTRLACKYIVGKVDLPLDLIDIIKHKEVDLEPYDVLGFACFTDFLAPPKLIQDFMEALPEQKGKPAFVFNTYGYISGKTLSRLARFADARGFKVFAGHTLHTPEAYPPMIKRGKGAEDSPSNEDMQNFHAFISELNSKLNSLAVGEQPPMSRIHIGLLNTVMPAASRTRARKDMGDKYVDEELCEECGTCMKGCPWDAIILDPKPIFDMDKCYGCWRCYNRCPEHAIYTDKFRGGPFYPRPNNQMKEMLKVQVETAEEHATGCAPQSLTN